ncbi:MAG: SigB/SigF/SigG family RNA polymerase sigma factor [Firmicutes bacterium]|jgi:RNA polymerase sporulation-specific sigma factor|nr:SigB/SigF/SigG family RNA polymerase sigma factor [Bacillota bacterium]MCL5065481.1 SigB/SigF/SigG family RNA polymerase sigma factor [Bacillota bacterium]
MPSDEEWDRATEDPSLYQRAQAGDEGAREDLVERHWNLIWHIVHRFQGRGYDSDDLFQVGSIGLLKAIDRFDVERGLKFSTYAVPLIMGEIRRFLRDDQPIRVARSLRELGMKVDQARLRLSQSLGHEPSAMEIAADLAIDIGDITEAMEAARPISSLNQPMDSANGNETRLEDNVRDPKVEADLVEQLALNEAFDRLESREQFILTARFVEGRTQIEVATHLGVSQVQISRLERRALERLRLALEDGDE